MLSHKNRITMPLIKSISVVCASLLLFLTCSGKQSEERKDVTSHKEILSDNKTKTDYVDESGYIVKVGDTAPDFEMELPSGEKVLLSSLRGKVVMLQFTASWCGVCRKEMPYIEKQIWSRLRDNPNFALYGIDREEPVEKIEELINKTGVTYPIGLDPDASIFRLYAKEKAGITRNVIIDSEGKIVMLTRLFEMEEFNEMVQVIDSLLNI